MPDVLPVLMKFAQTGVDPPWNIDRRIDLPPGDVGEFVPDLEHLVSLGEITIWTEMGPWTGHFHALFIGDLWIV
jgi:hypothetical protein